MTKKMRLQHSFCEKTNFLLQVVNYYLFTIKNRVKTATMMITDNKSDDNESDDNESDKNDE